MFTHPTKNSHIDFVNHFFRNFSHFVRLSCFLLLTTTSTRNNVFETGRWFRYALFLTLRLRDVKFDYAQQTAGWKSTLLYSKKYKMGDFRIQFCFFTRGVHFFSIENHPKVVRPIVKVLAPCHSTKNNNENLGSWKWRYKKQSKSLTSRSPECPEKPAARFCVEKNYYSHQRNLWIWWCRWWILGKMSQKSPGFCGMPEWWNQHSPIVAFVIRA